MLSSNSLVCSDPYKGTGVKKSQTAFLDVLGEAIEVCQRKRKKLSYREEGMESTRRRHSNLPGEKFGIYSAKGRDRNLLEEDKQSTRIRD